jgi:nitrate reductase NapD
MTGAFHPGSDSVSQEVHIAGVVVHAVPLHLARVRAAIERVDGVSVHATTPTGKCVVTLETLGEAAMLDRIGQIQQLDGVISAALVYQHADSLEAMNEELSDDYAA